MQRWTLNAYKYFLNNKLNKKSFLTLKISENRNKYLEFHRRLRKQFSFVNLSVINSYRRIRPFSGSILHHKLIIHNDLFLVITLNK